MVVAHIAAVGILLVVPIADYRLSWCDTNSDINRHIGAIGDLRRVPQGWILRLHVLIGHDVVLPNLRPGMVRLLDADGKGRAIMLAA
jgi:hypothetical protein